MKSSELINLFERFTGQKPPFYDNIEHEFLNKLIEKDQGICRQELNELLLYFGYGRISEEFYKFLLEIAGSKNEKIQNLDELVHIIEVFNIVSLLFYGNIKFSFKTLSRDNEQINYCRNYIDKVKIDKYTGRPDPLKMINQIDRKETFYLGVYIVDEIKKMYKQNPNNPYWKEEFDKMTRMTGIGKQNNDSYLVSDHMDVYIATSMRKKHEYVAISDFITELFNHRDIAPLKLRYFDPTQAYCDSRIDKGLTEALMLKRALCTIYLAQETDTLGKDSELATTLAQGKPVIAYVPIGDVDFVNNLIDISHNLDGCSDIKKSIFGLISIFDTETIWSEEGKKLRIWADDMNSVSEGELRSYLYTIVSEKYNKRASSLKEKHPLGIQINLTTGVANGVLVVRTINECAELLRAVVLNDFDLSLNQENDQVLELRENISQSVFRVMTNNQLLTNTFWNFYKETNY